MVGLPPSLVEPLPSLAIGLVHWPTPFLIWKIWLLALIGHFPTATWQPMTGPRGGHPLAHLSAKSYVSVPLS
jgi:hypothetical protein